jgi:hypothetical protein
MLALLLATAPSFAQSFFASMTGGQEVPPNSSPAVGSIQAVLSGNTLTVSGSFSGLLAAFTASHIHRAPAGTNGPVVVGLTRTPAGPTAGSYQAALNVYTLTPAQQAELLAGNYYVNVHSQLFPGGEIRGQLRIEEPVEAQEAPAAFTLHANAPNPFNPSTQIRMSLEETGHAKLTVHNLLGQQVAILVDGMLERGEHAVTFDAGNLPSGLYVYTLEVGGAHDSRRMLLAR